MGWRTRKQVGCSEVSGGLGEAIWSQKPTELKATKAIFLDGDYAVTSLKTGNSFAQGQTHVYLRLGFL